MATPSVNIFLGWSALSPRVAATRLANTSARSSVSSLAALRYALPQSHGLVPLVDSFVRAVEKGDWQMAEAFKRMIEGKIHFMSPKILAQAMFKISGRRQSQTPTRFERVEEATQRFALMLTEDGEKVEVQLAGRPDGKLRRPRTRDAVNTARLSIDEKIAYAQQLRRRGQKEAAATLFEGVARDCIDVKDYRRGSDFYKEAALLYLAVEDYVQARVAAARARYYFTRENFNEPERSQALQQLTGQVKAKALIAMKPVDDFDFANKLEGFFTSVAERHQEAGEKTLAGNAYHTLAYHLMRISQFDTAYDAANEAAHFFFEDGELELVGDALTKGARSLLAMGGSVEKVMKVAQKAARAYQRAQIVEKEALTYEWMGDRCFELKKFPLAADFYGRAAQRYRQAGKLDRAWEYKFKRVLAQTRTAARGSVPSLWTRRAREAEGEGDNKGAAEAHLMLSNHWHQEDQFDKEIEALRKAAGLFVVAREASSAIASYGLLSLAQKKLGQIHMAQGSWKDALRLLGSERDIVGEAALRAIVGHTLADLERWEEARYMLESSIRGLELHNDDRLGSVYETLAGVYLELKLPGEAAKALNKAHETYSRFRDVKGLQRVQAARRRLFPSN